MRAAEELVPAHDRAAARSCHGVLRPDPLGADAWVVDRNDLGQARIERIERVRRPGLRHGRGDVERPADVDVAIGDQGGRSVHRGQVPDHDPRRGAADTIDRRMGGDDVADSGRVDGVCGDGRKGDRAVGVVEDTCGIGEECGRAGDTARIARGRHRDRKDIRRDELEPLAVVVDVRADADEVVVVAELRVVVEQVGAEDPEPAPAVRQVARVGGLRPAEQQQVVAGRHAEARIEPAPAAAIPLDLRIADRRACAGSHERAVVGGADLVEAAVVDPDVLVDHLDVVARADGAGAVRRRDREIAQARAVEVVEEARQRRHGPA